MPPARNELSICILPKGAPKHLFSQWKKITPEEIAWRESPVPAGAAVWAVPSGYGLGINCCLMLSGVTGTALSTKGNANYQHMYNIRQILWAVLFSSLFIAIR